MVLKSTMRPCSSTKTREVGLIPPSDMLTSKRVVIDRRPGDGWREEHGRGEHKGVVDVGGQFAEVELRPRTVCHGDQAEKLAVHAALPGLVDIDTEHRQDASEVDTHVVDARRNQGGVVLPRLARHELLPWPLSELADEAGAKRPVTGPANHTHKPQVSLGGAGKSRDVLIRDGCSLNCSCRKAQPIDTRLEPAAHAKAKGPLPKSHCVAAFGMTVVTCRTTSALRQIRPVV